ncbi:MAG TPA: acetyl-CoA hydrolase/transferase C-terminal domain-containing protein [Thermodesulfobacteriota bacterium]|nr:acetyl-CoA hydrolase/transferase C-terminal domain-containing protein [Thermodesulfobacteriota bacterium]
MTSNKNWRDKYRKKIISGKEAAQKIKSGMSIADINTDEVFSIVNPLTQRRDIENITMYLGIMPAESPFAEPEKLEGRFKIYSLFLNRSAVPWHEKGLIDFIPAHNSRCSRMFSDRHIKIDAALLNLTPPDSNGFMSMSYHPTMHKPMIHDLKRELKDNFLVMACVNENSPFCCGDTLIHESEIDFMVEDHRPMKPYPWYTEEELGGELPKIAENVATLVDDAATLEFGIGKVPPHVCRALMKKNDLGIHTELLTGPVFELIKSGAVTGKYKKLHPYQAVFGFALPNSLEMFEWFDRNPVCTAYPLVYVCNPELVCKNYKFTAINCAVQVDLTGQDNSEVIFDRQWSGTGGHTDYSRGACMSEGGKSIVAMPSTAKGGTISRIVGGAFYPGGGTTCRTDIQYVVTEYGVAKLLGRGLKDCAHALIDIAHPKFRDELIEQAKGRHLW